MKLPRRPHVLLVVAAVLGAATFAVPAAAASRSEGPAVSPRGALKDYRFDDIPVRSALQLLAEEGGFNLVVSDTVKGNVSLHLRGVTWEQALDVVLQLKGLKQHVDGGSRSVDSRR